MPVVGQMPLGGIEPLMQRQVLKSGPPPLAGGSLGVNEGIPPGPERVRRSTGPESQRSAVRPTSPSPVHDPRDGSPPDRVEILPAFDRRSLPGGLSLFRATCRGDESSQAAASGGDQMREEPSTRDESKKHKSSG